MENQNYKIDEIFRQRLHDAEVPPPPFVWPAVEQALQKRRRRMVFVWLFAFGIVAACVGIWQLNPWHNVAQPTAHPTADNQKEEQKTRAKKPEQKATDVSAMDAVESAKMTRVGQQQTSGENKTASKGKLYSTESLALSSKTALTPLLEMGNQASSNQEQRLLATEGLQIFHPQLVFSSTLKEKEISPKEHKLHSRGKKAQPKFCYDFTRHPRAWLLDIYAGPSLAQRSLTSRLEDEPYLDQRLATERRSVAMNAGLRASLMFNHNLLVRTGLHYDHVTEVFEYIDPTTVIYRLQFTPGNPIPDTLGVEYGENYVKTYNRYGMLDIPLLVGVEMRQGRTGFSVNAGISANVLFQKRGAIIDPVTHEPARFGQIPDDLGAAGPKTGLSQDVFRANVGLSATASIQWYWHLNTHLRLFAEPSFRQVLRPVTLASHPVEQRYSIIGLRLGATMIF